MKTIVETQQEKRLQDLIKAILLQHRLQAKLLYKIAKLDIAFIFKERELERALTRAQEEPSKLSFAAQSILSEDRELTLQNILGGK